MVFFQDLFSRLFCDPCNIEYECCTDPDTIKERQLRTLRRPRPHRHLGTSSLTTPDHLLVSGYLRSLQRSCHSLHAHLGISVIAHLSTSYYLSNALRAHHHIYLLAEPCKDAQLFPALDDSADDIDDDELFPSNPFVDTQRRMPGELEVDANSDSTSGAVYFSDIGDFQRMNYGHLQLFELDGSPPTDSMIVKFAAMTAAQDVPLPPMIHSQLVHRYREQHSDRDIGEKKHSEILRAYSVCFKLCGSSKHGWSDSCSAVIVDETHGPRLDGSCAFRWRLPRFPHKTGGNGVTFSAEHGLLSVGGYKSAKCHALSFSSPAFFEQCSSAWKWRELPSMSAVRWFPSTAMMGDRLIAMAGSSANHEPLASVELFDFEREDWRSLSACSNPRKYGGLRQIGDRMVLGGGDHATQSVESYDATKNVWTCLPNTRLPHRYYPNLWGAEDKGGREIYISCSYSNSIEALDVRARDGWRVVCDGKLFENRITALQSLDYSQFRALR